MLFWKVFAVIAAAVPAVAIIRDEQHRREFERREAEREARRREEEAARREREEEAARREREEEEARREREEARRRIRTSADARHEYAVLLYQEQQSAKADAAIYKISAAVLAATTKDED